MSTFRDIPSLPPDGNHSVAQGSVNSVHFRHADECKCDDENTLKSHYAVKESRSKISGLLKINQQLLEDNELMKQCIIRLMENADLRSTNALSLAMSQTDERLRKFISESIAGNTPKDKGAADKHITESPPSGKYRTTSTISSNTSKSYGTSFKEVQLSELNSDHAAMTTNDSKLANDDKLSTTNRYGSPKQTSIQSYGKSFKEINLSELADESYFAKSSDTTVNNKHRQVLQSKNSENPSEFQSYGKSFKKVNLSELNNDPSSLQAHKYNSPGLDSYGKSFKQISLRELEGDPNSLGSTFSPYNAKEVRAKSPKIPENLLQHSNQNTTVHGVSQPPMKFGVGKSPYQKSPKSPVPQMHQTNSLSYESTDQPRVKKRRSRSRSERVQANGPYFLSEMSRRPMSTPLTRRNIQLTKPKRTLPPNHDIQHRSDKQNETRGLLPASLKQIVETENEKVKNTSDACFDCTNVPCKCHPNNSIDGLSKQMKNVLGESFSNDSLYKTSIQRPNLFSSNIKDTANEIKTATKGNKRVSETSHASKQFRTLPVVDSPIFTSTKVSKEVAKKQFPISPGEFETGPEGQREYWLSDIGTKRQQRTPAFVHEVFRSGVDIPNTTLVHQSVLRKGQYSSIASQVRETIENIPDRSSEEIPDHFEKTKLVQTNAGLPNQSTNRSSLNEVFGLQTMKLSFLGKTDNSKSEEQSHSKYDRTEAVPAVYQPTSTQDKDNVVKLKNDTLYQSANDGIGEPLAFSTPKSSPYIKHKEKRSVILTEETSIHPDTTPGATPEADNSTIVIANGESSKDGVPKRELFASVDSGNDEQMQTLDFLAMIMRFRGRAKVRYIIYRAVDTLLGYTPNLDMVTSAIQLAGKPNKRLVGEISFQLDRRILEFVFEGVKEKMGKRRSRYYGYSVASILQLIDKEVKYANHDADLNRVLRNRLEEILKRLNPLGYKIEHHSEFAQDMVNQFGLLNGEPELGSLEYLGMKEPAILRVVLGQTLLDDKDLDSMVVILDSLLYMADNDHRPIFVW